MYPVGLGFSPSVASAQAAGIKVSKAPYPDGPEGIALSLDTVAAKVREGRLDPRIRKRAIDVLRAAGIDGRDRPSVRSQVQALLDDLRATTIYIPDPVDSEHVTGAATLLCLSPTECVQGEDCESQVLALAAECMSIGISVQLVKQTFAQGGQEHLILKVQDEYGAWLPADPSDKSMPVGQSHPASREVAVDPMNPGATTYGMKTGAGAAGAVAPEIVTLGAHGLGGYPEAHRRDPRLDVTCPTCRYYAWHHGQAPVVAHDGVWMSHHPACPWLDGGPLSLGAIGLGATAPAFTKSALDLQNMVALPVQAGDTYLASGDYPGAIKAYQGAGQAGATIVGPEIDLAGAPNVTQPYTQQAWGWNGSLAAITGTDLASAQSAQGFVKAMLTNYENAIGAGSSAVGNAPAPAPGDTPSGAGGPGGVSTSTVVLGALGAGVLAGLALVAYRRRHPAAHENPVWRSKGGQFSYPGGARGRRMHRAGKCPHCQRGARECACGGR